MKSKTKQNKSWRTPVMCGHEYYDDPCIFCCGSVPLKGEPAGVVVDHKIENIAETTTIYV